MKTVWGLWYRADTEKRANEVAAYYQDDFIKTKVVAENGKWSVYYSTIDILQEAHNDTH